MKYLIILLILLSCTKEKEQLNCGTIIGHGKMYMDEKEYPYLIVFYNNTTTERFVDSIEWKQKKQGYKYCWPIATP